MSFLPFSPSAFPLSLVAAPRGPCKQCSALRSSLAPNLWKGLLLSLPRTPWDQAEPHPLPASPTPQEIVCRGLSFPAPTALCSYSFHAPPHPPQTLLRVCSFIVLVAAGQQFRRILLDSLVLSFSSLPPAVSGWHCLQEQLPLHSSLEGVLFCLSQYPTLSPCFHNADLSMRRVWLG